MDDLLQRIAHLYNQKTKRHKNREQTPNLNQRLRNLLKDAIINNDIPRGTTLPPTRVLAETLSVSRSTVIKAYELLKLEGYIESTVGSKHIVKDLNNNSSLPEVDTNENQLYPSLSDTAESFMKTVSLINSTDDKSIAFRPGLPPLDIFPVNKWKNLSNAYWRYIKSSALSYSPSTGIDLLKQNIANYLNLSRQIKCDPRQIIIVSGSLQSLYLIGNVVLNPSDSIVIENPTFPNVLSMFKGLRAQVKGIGVDENGLKTEELKNTANLIPKLIHVTPSSHYPNGVRMSLARRKELLKYAEEKGSFIIENDYEHEVHNHKEMLPSLFSLDKHNRTIYLSTFNRLLHPSIRIGFMVLPPYLLHPTEALLKHSHRFVPPSIQVVLNQFIERNYLHNHVREVTQVAEEREAIFTENFNNNLSKYFTLQKNQTPSLHVLAHVNNGISDMEITQFFGRNNIIVHAYSKCFVEGQKQQGLILGYSSVRPPVIKDRLSHMAKIYPNLKK